MARGPMLEGIDQNMMQDNNMGLRPQPSDTHLMANSGTLAQGTGVNGNAAHGRELEQETVRRLD